MRYGHKLVLGVLAAIGGLTSVSAPASADPLSKPMFHLVCENGQSYDVVAPGGGPGMDLDSTTVVVAKAENGDFFSGRGIPQGLLTNCDAYDSDGGFFATLTVLVLPRP
jgi:hypothetical protein